MNAAVLLIGAWLTHSSALAVPDAPPQNTRRGVLDVVVFYADAPRDLDRYPLPVQRELRRFLERAPEIPVSDVDKAAEYYANVLGFSHHWGNDAGGIGGISQGDCRMFLTNPGS